MSTPVYISSNDVEGKLSWENMVNAIEAGHQLPKARIGDLFLSREDDTLLNRAAWVDGLGFGLKTVSVMSGNAAQGLPSVQGVMVVYDEHTGSPRAFIDSQLITYWKTAADSVLGARYLARKDSRRLLIVGAGQVAASIAQAYSQIFPMLEEILVWNRTESKAHILARALCEQGMNARSATALDQAAAQADIIVTATMSKQPVLQGAFVKPGTHIDLIGAFRADMREADDQLLRSGRIFVDSYETTLEHIGELKIPLESGAITRDDILGDFYAMAEGQATRRTSDEITIFKNGGGAHLDLMIAMAILDAYGAK